MPDPHTDRSDHNSIVAHGGTYCGNAGDDLFSRERVKFTRAGAGNKDSHTGVVLPPCKLCQLVGQNRGAVCRKWSERHELDSIELGEVKRHGLRFPVMACLNYGFS